MDKKEKKEKKDKKETKEKKEKKGNAEAKENKEIVAIDENKERKKRKFPKLKLPKLKLPKRRVGVAAVVVVAAVLTVICVNSSSQAEETYRNIQICGLSGTATIIREEIGSIDAVEDLYLESGDRIMVSDDSYMRIRLDDDKYILAEENSTLTIVAYGTAENSRTSINLEEGAVTNEIQNQLNDASSYNVTAPNAVMAVRGTVFRVETTTDESAEVYTKVSTFEGSVGNSLIMPNGMIDEELVFVEGGQEAIIYMDAEITDYLSEPQDIDYESLPLEVLEFLQEIVANGTELDGITIEELISLTDGEPLELVEDTEEFFEEQMQDEMIEDEMIEEEIETPDDEFFGEDEEVESEAKVQPKTTRKQTTTASTTYTVTFEYQGEVFGTQIVEEGQKAMEPKLSPDEEGEWDFDFSETIEEDTTICWE